MKTKRPLASFRVGLPGVGGPATTPPVSTRSPHYPFPFPPSPEQRAIDQWVCDGSGSAFIEALAGTGKTATILAVSRRMTGSVAFTAFNRAISDEIKAKVTAMGDEARHVRVGTFHSFGYAAWRRHAVNVEVDANRKHRRMMGECDVPYHIRSAIRQLVSLGKQSLVGVDGEWAAVDDYDRWGEIIDHYSVLTSVPDDGTPEEDVVANLIYHARKCVEWARKPEIANVIIDYDDMLWLPLLENVPVDKFQWLLVDELQDSNAARRMMIRRMLSADGRLLGVGDKHQSIFGFAGATANAVDIVVRDFQCTVFPLTTTFRCSKAATRLAQTFVPEIVAAEGNEEGAVYRASSAVYARDIVATAVDSEEEVTVPRPSPGDAILCRNTKPIVSLAFRFIREGIPAHVEGRDIGKSLDALASRWRTDDVTELARNLEAYRQRETARLVAEDRQYAVEALHDRVDSLSVVMDGCGTVREVREKIERMFRDTESGEVARTITLATVHRAKGREWQRVFVLGWDTLMPSRYAKKEWEIVQEGNLQYVAVTRTKRDLILTGVVE